MSENINKINDEALDQVVGGKKCRVYNSAVDYANVRSYAGIDEDNIEYRVYNGNYVWTTGRVKYNIDGYDWYQLDDGNWIAGSLIGY